MAKKTLPKIEQRVAHFIREHQLVSGEKPLLVAVSGGADSVCLLHVLAGLQEELGISLHIAHLDHRLRGADSVADADYVKGLAGRLDIPLTVGREDVKAYQKMNKISLEEAAREVRYRFLAETADSVGADRVATGHTIDDHVETMLMHLVRGTGTRGLVGLKPVSRWRLGGREITIVRPLLGISRQETDDYCRDNKLEPRLDATNLLLSPLRNRIRQQLLPMLQDYNPGVAEALLRTATNATDELAFLDDEMSRVWDGVVKRYGKTIAFDKREFGRLNLALKRHLLRTAMEHLLGNLKDIEARHIEEIIDVLDKPAGKQVSLPWGMVFAVEYERYLLGKEPSALCPFPPLAGEHSLDVPSETKLPGWLVKAEVIGREEITEKGRGFVALIDLDETGGRLSVRHRKTGDRFQPLGLSAEKKLNEFMIDARIPRTWRERIPVVCASGRTVDTPGQIIWLVGYRIDERVKITEKTKRVLRLEFKPE
ncbi:MAG TPA: tRNA lysidine(34) synthetase TilS [Dehalococcoidia bacterium]|nr:tRNA lysidine(34) synthetase TilS [Dehalococcoidia bacterium]